MTQILSLPSRIEIQVYQFLGSTGYFRVVYRHPLVGEHVLARIEWDAQTGFLREYAENIAHAVAHQAAALLSPNGQAHG